MKKLAINFLKSADEKLRNLGRTQNQPATIDQTQHFTFVRQAPLSLQQLQQQQQQRQRQKEIEEEGFDPQRHSPQQDSQSIQTDHPPHHHHRQLQQHHHQQQQQQQQPQQQLRSRFIQEADNCEAGINPNMAERVRYAKRERNKTNLHRTTEEMDQIAANRRSKSEGPIRRVRQCMDERGVTRKQGEGGWSGHNANVGYGTDSESDEGNYLPKPRVESDSDSDHQTWVKNPLVVRRVKKSDKNSKKRLSGTDYRGGSSSRNSLVTSGKGDEQGSSGGDNSSRTGTGNRSSQRFQKLEELRKKRINLSVTSDEENTPASRISRLRQRAIQSGLGDHPRPVSNVGISQAGGGNSEMTKLQSPKVAISPYPASGAPPIRFGIADAPRHTHNTQQHHNIENSFPASVSTQPLKLQNSGLNMLNQLKGHDPQRHRNITQQNNSKQNNFPGQSVHVKPTQKIAPMPVGVSSAHQQSQQTFNTVPDHHSHASRSLYNSSPEINKRRCMPQVRIPSADSIHKVSSFPNEQRRNNIFQQEMKPVTSPLLSQSVTQQQQQQQQQQQRRPLSKSTQMTFPTTQPMQSSYSKYGGGDVKTSQQHKMMENKLIQALASQHSEDSLDELIESNIQYLDREIGKTKTKQLSNSSLSNDRKTHDFNNTTSAIVPNTSQALNQSQFQYPVDQRQQNPNVPRHVTSANRYQLQSIQITEPPHIDTVHQTPARFEDTREPKITKSVRQVQPDVVPVTEWKLYDGPRRLSRPGSDFFDKEDLSKSDSQLNVPILAPTYIGNRLPSDRAYARGCVSDVNLTSELSVEDPLAQKGMFSDVDYDIEVSERVKKWEKYIKKPDSDGSVKTINLASIQERQENEALMLPSEVRKSVLFLKNEGVPNRYNESCEEWLSQYGKSQNLDVPMITDTHNSPKATPIETRYSRVAPNALSVPRLGIESQSMSSVFQPSSSIELDKQSSNSSTDLRSFYLLNQNSRPTANPETTITSINTSINQFQQPRQPFSYSHSASQSQDEGTPMFQRANKMSNARKEQNRMSQYQEEIDDVLNAKDSVLNLRRRFDPESGNLTSEDDQQSVVSTASAKLSRPSKLYLTNKDQESVDLSRMIPGYENKIKDLDVWSPNLESTAGVPVSIERVKARTLQTIPFSEDPFWKEIEEMTSFDPNSSDGHLSLSSSQSKEGIIVPQHSDVTSSPHSSTLPNHSRHTVSTRERLQRSKSLYTPNITPLSINVDKTKGNAPNALDEVLDDIRTSMERQHLLSPKKRGLEKNMWSSVDSNPGYKMEGGQLTFANRFSDIQLRSAQKIEPKSITQMRADQPALPSKQPLQFYQLQRTDKMKNEKGSQPQLQPQKQPQLNPGGVSGYHLDADLLKQKLLKTGLVVETDTEEGPVITSSAKDFSKRAMVDSASSNHLPTSIAVSYHLAPSSTSAPQSRKQSFLSMSGVQSGPNALDDIQRALDNIKSSPYQSESNSLFGTSKLKPFEPLDTDTTRGPNTRSTGWTFQPKTKQDQESKSPLPSLYQDNKSPLTSLYYQDNKSPLSSLYQDSVSPLPSVYRDSVSPQPPTYMSEKRHDVNESTNDLDDLAQSVESRINTIKTKLYTADESNLDGILSSLKKFTPDSKFSQETPTSFNDYYKNKKSKLTNALSELDRIHASLDLKQYTRDDTKSSVIPPQPKSEHLRPMQMRISSMYIPGLQANSSEAVDKEVESEFDVISKSFQAIIDEVNKTSNILGRSNSVDTIDNLDHAAISIENRQAATVSETQTITDSSDNACLSEENKHTPTNTQTKIDVHDNTTISEEITPTNTVSENQTKMLKITLQNNETAVISPVPDTLSTKSPPKTAPKPQLTNIKDNKHGSVVQNEGSKLVSGFEQDKPESTVGSVLELPSNQGVDSVTDKSLASGGLNTTNSVSSSTPPPSRSSRTRTRPVKDNKIIQEDRAARREGPSRIFGMPPSPQPSPKLPKRTIIFDNGNHLDVKIDPPSMFQDSKEDETPSLPKVTQTKEETEDKIQEVSESVPPPAIVPNVQTSAVVSLTKIPQSTSAKSTHKSPGTSQSSSSQIPVPSSKVVTLEKAGTASPQTKVRANLKVNLASTNSAKKAISSTDNTTPAPTVDKSQSDPKMDSNIEEDGKHEDDSATSKGRRNVKSSVALIMDKLKGSEGERSGGSSPKIRTNKNSSESASVLDAKNPKPKDKRISPSVPAKKIESNVKNSKSIPQKGINKSSESSRNISSSSTTHDAFKGKRTQILSQSPKKPFDRDVKVPGGSGSSTPSSPSTKPLPRSSWKRPTSDPERPRSGYTPSTSSKTNTNKSGSGDSEGPIKWHKTYDTPKATKKLINLKPAHPGSKPVGIKVVAQEVTNTGGLKELQPSDTRIKAFLPSPRSVRRRVRPTHRKIQTESASASSLGSSGDESYRQRPHSFHEFGPDFTGDARSQYNGNCLRKYSSADGLLPNALESKDFRPKHDQSPTELVTAVLNLDLENK